MGKERRALNQTPISQEQLQATIQEYLDATDAIKRAKKTLKRVEPVLLDYLTNNGPVAFPGGILYTRVTRTTKNTNEDALVSFLKSSMPDLWDAVKKESVDLSKFQAFVKGGIVREEDLIEKGIITTKQSFGLGIKSFK